MPRGYFSVEFLFLENSACYLCLSAPAQNAITKNSYIMQTKTILSLLLILFAAATLPAQVVKETEKMMSFGSRPCFRMEFPNATTDMVEDLWKNFAKKNFGAKLKKKGGEWSANDLKSAMMGPDPFSLYSTTEKTGTGVALNVWLDEGSGFLNSRDNPSRAREISAALKQFFFDVRRATYDQQVKDEEKKLKDLEKNNQNMAKTTKDLEKSIEDYKAKIKKAEEEILRLAKEQEVGMINIDNQRKVIEEVRQRKLNVESEGN